MNERESHWENIYKTHQPTEVSWFQAHPTKSLDLIRSIGIGQEATIIDIGGGASTLADNLLNEGFTNMTVLDISAEALIRSTQ